MPDEYVEIIIDVVMSPVVLIEATVSKNKEIKDVTVEKIKPIESIVEPVHEIAGDVQPFKEITGDVYPITEIVASIDLVNISGEVAEVSKSSFILGEDIDDYKAVCLIKNEIFVASNNIPGRGGVIGILIVGGVKGQEKEVTYQGPLYNPSWNWEANSNEPLFLGVDGELTQIFPFGENISIVEVGVVFSPQLININIEETFVFA